MFGKNKNTVIKEVKKRETYYKVDNTCCRWMKKHIDIDIFYSHGNPYLLTSNDRIPINYCPNCGKKVIIKDITEQELK